MKILQIHCNSIEYIPIKKELNIAEAIQPKTTFIKDLIVAFISVEKNDTYITVDSAVSELKNVITNLKCNTLLLYPYSHLSSELSSPQTAFELIMKIKASLLPEFNVTHAPFGWTKSYKLDTKNHPLAEHLITIKNDNNEKKQLISNALQLESKITSQWYVLTPDSLLTSITTFDFTNFKQLELLFKYETMKKNIIHQKPPHIQLMKKLAIADYEPSSDHGNMKFYPNGKLIKSLIERYVTDKILEYGGLEVETPIMYDSQHPSLKNYFNRFPARQYTITSDNKELILRFAACFGQFLMVNNFNMTYKTLPLKIYELTRYSFRREQSGELSGLRRLRAFTMPDCHAFCKDMKQAINEIKKRFRLSKTIINELGISDSNFEMVIRTTRDFFNENRELLNYLSQNLGKPLLIEIWDKKFFYFIFKWEFNYIDNLNNASALSTDQIDVENGERFKIKFTNETNQYENPIILHNSPSGAIERIIYALLENAAKDIQNNIKPYFPLWLAPIQARLIPLNQKFNNYCELLANKLHKNKIRVDIDDRSYNANKKIRLAETEWIHYILIIGEKEITSEYLNIRDRKSNTMIKLSFDDFINTIKDQINDKPYLPLNLNKYASNRPLLHNY